ncbi:MAG TPA: glycosyltransferase family 39 protein [Terriglobales bacterium]|nr:glycosyltransferase family 39 protein [Terriglobales bacterium]
MSSLLELVVVLAICGVFFFYGIGSFGLVGADEPRYAQIAREMLARGDWVSPVLNGTAWLEKPVLYYWGAMVSYSVFGVSDWAARVPTAFMTTLMTMAVYGLMRRFRQGSQVNTAIILASMAAIIGFARAASTDMPLTAMFTIAMLGWFAWYETRSSRFLSVFYFFLALATLAKGPVAVFLAGAILLIFLALRRDWKAVAKTLWVPGILLYLVVALPWFVLVQLANPQFFRVFILEHNLARYSTEVYRHTQPVWYFLPVLILGLLPWLVFAGASFARAVRKGIRERSSFELFFVIWAAFPVVFFSFSGSKLPGYILPAIPPFALLAGEYLWRKAVDTEDVPLWMKSLHALFISVLLGAALLTNYFVLKMKPVSTALWIAIIAGTVCFIAMLTVSYLKGIKVLRVATLLPIVLALVFILKFAAPSLDAMDSQRPVDLAVKATKAPVVAVYSARREVEYGLNFYRNQPIPNYSRGEIPTEAHLVVTPAGYHDRLQLMVPGRSVTEAGGFPPQKLAFYMVGAKE